MGNAKDVRRGDRQGRRRAYSETLTRGGDLALAICKAADGDRRGARQSSGRRGRSSPAL